MPTPCSSTPKRDNITTGSDHKQSPPDPRIVRETHSKNTSSNSTTTSSVCFSGRAQSMDTTAREAPSSGRILPSTQIQLHLWQQFPAEAAGAAAGVQLLLHSAGLLHYIQHRSLLPIQTQLRQPAFQRAQIQNQNFYSADLVLRIAKILRRNQGQPFQKIFRNGDR